MGSLRHHAVSLAWVALLALAMGTALADHAANSSPGREQVRGNVRAAYFYDYMDFEHLDVLARRGFNRALIRHLEDSLSGVQVQRLPTWANRGQLLGVEVVPVWKWHAVERLEALSTTRRYTWGRGESDLGIPCPLDRFYWRSALFDRAEEILELIPETKRLGLDLELHAVSHTHYDAGPCRCAECLAEYTGMPLGWYQPGNAWRLSGLMSYEESRIVDILVPLLREFGERYPGVEMGVLDLDLDSFVHRALARALAVSGVPTTDYCERSYGVGGKPLAGARARLDELGLADAPLVGGLWLKRFAPAGVPPALRSINDRSDGYFIFTTFSLWRDPALLDGPYTLLDRPEAYWLALEEVNRSP